METYTKTQSDPPHYSQTGLEESMRKLGLDEKELYPERLSEPNCVYYMRTGSCGYGDRCRFNHPRNRALVVGTVTEGVEYPERDGQPVCKFYLKTGTCKFGAYCKFHHPKNVGGIIGSVSLNANGYPLRPGENECSYYVKTGQCKFGIACKFHHPQPAGTSVSAPAPAFYQTVQSSLVPSSQHYEVAPNWQVTRPPLISGSYLQGAYGHHVLLPSGMVPMPWNTYPAPVSPVASPSTHSIIGPGSFYGVTQVSSSAPSYTGPYPSLPSSASISSGFQNESTFPERPGQPECIYYVRNGHCKYGSSCRYHHPPERLMPSTSFVLSHMGLPLRPGAPPCSLYVQYGVCEFGPTCKYDHPMGTLSYSPSSSSLADMPVAPYPVGSLLATLAPSSSTSDLQIDVITGFKNSISPRVPSSENMSSGSVGSILSRSGPILVNLSGPSSSP
ncbi:hypothetical protein IFM89_037511 [Coptis chinensis]|uniref:C3H1-type domain-containing protein n=1 Tax=Coptis chinensis TaxID=261450 RepID=A0A835MDI8_9MAGN|nr:hypothetical protein IFM89_037511 [Coptis chinensis]